MRSKILKSSTDEEVVVVCWDDKQGMVAFTIPVNSLPDTANSNGEFDLADVLEVGTPYGISEEEFVEMLPTEAILVNLRNKGIWTLDDMKKQSDLIGRVVSAHICRILEAL